jgi:hypothetical protein
MPPDFSIPSLERSPDPRFAEVTGMHVLLAACIVGAMVWPRVRVRRHGLLAKSIDD